MAAGKARQYLDLGGAKNIEKTKKIVKTKKTKENKQFWGSLEERGVSSQESLRIVGFVFFFCFPKVFWFFLGCYWFSLYFLETVCVCFPVQRTLRQLSQTHSMNAGHSGKFIAHRWK